MQFLLSRYVDRVSNSPVYSYFYYVTVLQENYSFIIVWIDKSSYILN